MQIPGTLPANANSLDWIVQGHRPQRDFVKEGISVIQDLSRDPEWEAVEARLTAHCNQKVRVPFRPPAARFWSEP